MHGDPESALPLADNKEHRGFSQTSDNKNTNSTRKSLEMVGQEEGEEETALLGNFHVEKEDENNVKKRSLQRADQETHRISGQACTDDEEITQYQDANHQREGEISRSSPADEEMYSPQKQVAVILARKGQEVKNGSGDNLSSSSNNFPSIFTELEELLTFEDGNSYWKETARWIKFQEIVETGGDRWSKPHVPTLNLQTLFELRSCIMNGTVLFDVGAHCLEDITDAIMDEITFPSRLPHDDKLGERVKDVILSGHNHQNVSKWNYLNAIKSFKEIKSKRESLKEPQSNSHGPRQRLSTKTDNNNVEAGGEKRPKTAFMKKIPPGAEACNILIGEVDFLQRPVVAFVRLKESAHLEGMTEVPVPTRFMFVVLGPVGNQRRYHEIGRTLATLMSDVVFHDIAYTASTRSDILAGIDEFLSQVIVLPPAGWDLNIRIDPPQNLTKHQTKRLESRGGDGDSVKNGDAKQKPAHTVGPELERTGRLFGGLINDVKRKVPFYFSDFRDGLSLQCIASFIFLYFAVLTPTVTFGGMLGDATHNSIGAMESIFGSAIVGICYHFLAGQPLTIVGSTGPVFVFEKIMFKICRSVGIEFLPIRWWVGTWTGLICMILVATDSSSLVQYITRYTEESFSALISLIFIYEAFEKLSHTSDDYRIWHGWNPDLITHYECSCVPKNLSAFNITEHLDYAEISWESEELALKSHHHNHNGTLYRTGEESYVCSYDGHNFNVSSINNVSWSNLNTTECLSIYCGGLEGTSCGYAPDQMLMSVFLFVGTFAVATYLKKLKTSRYFPTKVRSVISDFAVTIAISSMVLLDIAMKLDTPKLHVPESFRPTRQDRGWIISPLGENHWWTIPLAIAPALLCTILVFMDQQITAVIVNRKENKLKKGGGYHLDLLIVSVMLIVCSVFGLPWFVAATVRSITHVNSLRVESESAAPGEAPKFLGVREQRVTGIMIFLLIGLSVFMTPVLAFIPMPVLYGVFLYMGVSSLKGVQFIDRCKLFLMPPKHQPDYIYLRHVPLPKVYLFTFIQIVGLVLLWIIKSTQPISIVFPMMIAALIAVRKAFDHFLFTQNDLQWLDDIMPESTKRKKEDKKKKKKRGAKEALGEPHQNEDGLNTVNTVSTTRMDNRPDEQTDINISESMAETAIWKTIVKNDLGPDVGSTDRYCGQVEMEREEDGTELQRRHSNQSNDEDISDQP